MNKNGRMVLLGASMVGALLLVVLVVYFVAKKRGKEASMDGNTGKLPHETTEGKGLTQEESKTVARLARELHEDMKGLNVFGHNSKPYAELAVASDRVLVGTANYFYTNYSQEENLAQWIRDERYSGTTYDYACRILERLAQVGITAK